jgi:hypothetical protein
MFNKIITFIILLFAYTKLWAGCTPEAIEFYLDKGFTQEQITKLCAQTSEPIPKYQPYQKPIVIYQEGVGSGSSIEERRAVNELRGSIDGRSVDITEETINYISPVCILAGNAPEKDQRVKKCLDVAFSISRDGLQVNESSSGILFFGQQSIEVSSSKVIRKHVTADPWSEFSPDIRYLLKRKYESDQNGNSVEIPLIKSSTPSNVVNAIRTLSSNTYNKKTGATQSEVAKVLDETYVPPTEEEYIASLPTEEEIKKEKKKNKKWWNPFD